MRLQVSKKEYENIPSNSSIEVKGTTYYVSWKDKVLVYETGDYKYYLVLEK